MPAEVTAVDMAGMEDTVGMLLEHTQPQVISKADTVVFMLAVDVVIRLRGPRAARPALQGAHVIGMAAVTGEAVTGAVIREAVTGEAVTGPMDLRWAITAWAMAIHPTG